MNQTSSSPNMSKSTADTIKQIQKQGLSISIVSTDSARSVHVLDSSVSKEQKPKQILPIDKTPKLPSRSLVPTESKATLSQARSIPISSVETRASGGQPLNQSVSQESKMPGTNSRSVVPISTSTETRAFGSQSWSNPPSSESKVQTGSNRAVQSAGVVYTENKSSVGPVRISQSQISFIENKNQIAKGNQNMTDSKSQGRVSVANLQPESKLPNVTVRNHLTFEGKVPNSQSRNPLNSPPLEGKVINTRLIQNVSQDSKGVQRTIPQAVTEGKVINIQSKLTPRLVGVKLPTQAHANQILKTTTPQANKVIVLDHQSTQLSSLGLNNAFRTASTSLGEKASATSDEKPSVKTNRVAQNIVKTKNQSSMSNFQSMSMPSEGKAVSQVVKISSGPSNNSQKMPISFDTLSDASSSPLNTMSSARATPKRPQTARVLTSTPAKRKCVKRNSPNAVDPNVANAEANVLDTEKPKQFEMQGITRGLTITPVNSTTTCASTSSGTRKTTESAQANNIVALCPKCQEHSTNTSFCVYCKARIPASSPKFHVTKLRQEDLSTMVVEQKIYTTTSRVEKKIVYQLASDMTQNQSFNFHQAVQGKVRIESTTPVSLNARGKGRPKGRRKPEPICYTLSSDEEDPMPFHPMEEPFISSQIYPIESEGSKSDHSSTSEMLHDENQESDDPQYPGVMDINPNLNGEEEPDEDVVFDREEMDEEEEEEEEEHFVEEDRDEDELDDEEDPEEEMNGQLPTDYPLRCRSIRIGSFKVHPPPTSPFVAVLLQEDCITFSAPVLTESHKHVVISLRHEHIKQLVFHFGRSLPIMFVYTTPQFGESVRNALHMVQNVHPCFDPTSRDDKTQKLTFLIEFMTEDQKNFIRQVFPGDKKVLEIDQKTANEILVRSTPAATASFVKLKVNDAPENPLPHISNQLSVTKVILPPQPPQPVVKLFTYPPPPQTGGIAVTNEDLACLNEGEFLNDVIIDFFLKYVFCEKLSHSNREKTHIFSSFFYPRLTHKSERQRVGDDPTKTAQFKRHNQVKTWTRHVDIFSKDYIIIPVNMNVHWFLAIICFPNRVPEAPSAPESKATDSVTSTDEQEHVNKVTIKEISSNGEDNSPNQDESSMNSSLNSPYMVEEPPDSDEYSETPDSSTHPDGKQRKEMPCICIFDSLTGPNRWRIATTLREYLEMEWKCKKGTRKIFDKNTMQGFIIKCPQQTNFSDCGLYLLQFVESFFENPIPFANPMPDLTNWFTEVKINKKRQELKDLILSLQKKQANTSRRINQDRNQSSSTNMTQTDNR